MSIESIEGNMVSMKYVPSDEALKFIAKAKDKYGDKYSYDKVEYLHNKSKVIITCPEHGDFMQSPNQHLKKRSTGCTKCGIEKRRKSKTYTTEKFISKAKVKHSNFYDYSFVEYSHNSDKVHIVCPKHGKFTQAAYVHLYGQGCPECGVEKTTLAKQADPCKNGWSYSKWKSRGENNKDFDGFKLYIIECTDGDETFIKIGKTFTTVAKRYYGSRLPYNWRVVTSVVGTAEYISSLEEELHRNLNSAGYKYTPKKKFDGSNECYKCNYTEEINI